MPKSSVKLVQNVFEARYERGYRYLDRCGDAMVILEEALPAISNNNVWMPEEMQPTGARIKCPDIDVTVAFDAYRLCVDHNPADVKCPFEAISKYVFDTVVAKFDIRKIIRLGNRQFYVIPTDSVEDADQLSVKKVQLKDWPKPESNDMNIRQCQVTTVFENSDRSIGTQLCVKPVSRVEAPLQVEKRLRTPPHLLATGQREALIGQLRRQKQREQDPVAGLMVDIDYNWVKPEEVTLETFFDKADKEIKYLTGLFQGK